MDTGSIVPTRRCRRRRVRAGNPNTRRRTERHRSPATQRPTSDARTCTRACGADTLRRCDVRRLRSGRDHALREIHRSVNERRAELLLSLGPATPTRRPRSNTSSRSTRCGVVVGPPSCSRSTVAPSSRGIAGLHPLARTARRRPRSRARPAAARLEARVLAQDPTLDAVVPERLSTCRATRREQPARRRARSNPCARARVLTRRTRFRARPDRKLVRAGRLTTLSGVGGVGKTRLAIEVARTLRMSGRPGHRARIASARRRCEPADPSSRRPSVPNVNPHEAVATQLGTRLRSGSFDTCEQCWWTRSHCCRRHAARRNRACAHTLDEPAAARRRRRDDLDCAAARARRRWRDRARRGLASARCVCSNQERAPPEPTSCSTTTTRAMWREICRSLDGLPLRSNSLPPVVNLMSPARIIERLDDRFAFLSRGVRTAESRASLRALIEWSYDLLTRREKIFFGRLSVFGGSFDLNAAAAIAGDDSR